MTCQEISLGKASIITMGVSPRGDTYNNEGIGIPLLNGPTEFGVISPNCTLYTTNSKRECKKGDLIFCVRGSTTGRMNWADTVYSLGRGVCSIHGETQSDTKFIKYCIDLKLTQLLQLSGGSTFPNLTKDDLGNLLIPYPLHRSKISSILSAYDDLIENNTRRIKILEEMAQTIYNEWFVKFRFPGHEKVKMVDSELGMIPEGWVVRKLSETCAIVMGQSPKSEYYNSIGEGLPFHQGVTDFGNRFPIDTNYCTKPQRIAEAGDILFSVRAPVGRINVTTKKIVIGRGLCAIRNNGSYQNFTFHQLKDKFQEEDSMGGGTIFKAVTKSDMYGIKLITPPKTLIQMFESIIVPVSSEIKILTDKNINLCTTRDLLLPRLISGEVDVSTLDINVEEITA